MYIEGLNYQGGQPIRIKISEGKIAEIFPLSYSDKKLPVIAPGLVDLQVNGYGGIDFNTVHLQIEDIHKAVRLLASQGITSFYPTLITNTDSTIRQALQNILLACKIDPELGAAIGGIHLEGPFLSKEDGARGAHSLEFVQQPDWELFQEWQNVAEGKIRIITMSPEWDGAAKFIKKCSDTGVIVAIGHTAATPEQINAAVQAGAQLSTHLGNGAHLMLPRHPNYLWEQLAQDQLWATVIADGFHLPGSFLKVVFRMKPETSILISDCTEFTGLTPGVYKSHIGGEVLLNSEGRLCIAGQPKLLAGSAQSLLWCVNQVAQKGLLSFSQAWNKASLKPIELLTGKQHTSFQVGEPANLVLFEQNKDEIKVRKTLIHGKIIFDNSKE